MLGGGGLPRGLGHNLLMQFSRLGSSKMEISETDFFDTLTIQNDQISYVKHVLAPLSVFFILFGCLGGGGGAAHHFVQTGLPTCLLCRVSIPPYLLNHGWTGESTGGGGLLLRHVESLSIPA